MNDEKRNRLKSDRMRLLTRGVLAGLITLGSMLFIAMEGFFYRLPIHPSKQSNVILLMVCGPVTVAVLRRLEQIRKYDSGLADFAKWVLKWTDRFKLLVISQITGFAWVVLLGLIGFCLIWVPEYLVQPLWTDHEHVLVMARLWDLGKFPWTAMHTYQFPGEMEIAWLSAKLFGWGNPKGYFLMDLIIQFVFCLIMMIWAQRQLGHWRYGVFAIAGFILYEATLPFTGIAQRDSHATLFAIMAFCLPGLFQHKKLGDILAGLVIAISVAIRPHSILFMPLILCGIWWSEQTQSSKQSQEKSPEIKAIGKRFLVVLSILAIVGLILFMPIIGLVRTKEFLNALRFPLVQDSNYNRGIFAEWTNAGRDYYRVARHFWFITFSVLMIVSSKSQIWRYRGYVMLIVAISGGLYRMVHPVDHGYLKQPLIILECIGLAVYPAWLVMENSHLPGLTWFSMMGLMIYIGQIDNQFYVEMKYAPIAYESLITGNDLPYSPPGARNAYPNRDVIYHYDWIDWIQAKNWLRIESTKQTKVLNLLTYQPFPPFLATLDRLPIGRLESIVLMNWFTKYDFDSEVVKDLEHAPAGSLVAWDGNRTNVMNYGNLLKTRNTIHQLYSKRAEFGEIEFWEKNAAY
jgi:hypothetical protein